MNLLLLRGSVPKDRSPSEITFNNLQDSDDLWTQLLSALLSPEDYAEVWYWGGKRTQSFNENLVERWFSSFNKVSGNFKPDVIISRGGFREYHPILKKHSEAFKIYYGAGRRFLPRPGFTKYDLVLVDSPEQLKICKEKIPDINSSLFIKPAPDNIFFTLSGVKKEFDVCFPANGGQAKFKGHKFVFSTVPQNIRVLNLGNTPPYPVPKNVTRRRVLKRQMPEQMQKCEMGIVCSNARVDSCPRVIPEMLACGLPIVVLDETRLWKEKYISPQSGRIANRNNFWEVVQDVLDNLDSFSPRQYYEETLCMEKAANFLRKMLPKTTP